MNEKVLKCLVKAEIDFPELPIFSFRYYCLADDEIKAKSFATSDILKRIEKQNKILIAVNEDVLISKFLRIITYEDCKSVVQFIKNM